MSADVSLATIYPYFFHQIIFLLDY